MTSLTPVQECQSQAAAYQFNQAAWTREMWVSAGTAIWMPHLCKEYQFLAPFSCHTRAVTPVERSLGWQDIGGSTELALEAQMGIIAQLYELRDPKAVRAYLRSHRFLVPLLQDARGRISEWFTDSIVALEVSGDPDKPGTRRLVASIHTALDPSEALKRLDAFDEAWWVEASREADSRVLIDVEYTE